MKSVMTPQQLFNQVARPEIQRSTFDRSHGYKTTFDAGKIIPIFCDEALPGDTLNLKAHCFGRIATLLKPPMDNIAFDIHFFSVPIRLVFDNWVKLNGEQTNPDDHTNYLMPTITAPVGGYGEASIYDYLGLPTKIAGIEHRADFLRAYNLIWNTWYRDENLQDSVSVPKGDGPDAHTLYNILPRGKRKDYFTSALPWAQKADPVSIPLGDTANVVFPTAPISRVSQVRRTVDNANIGQMQINTGADDTFLRSSGSIGGATEAIYLEGASVAPTDVYADLSTATATTINALREAFQIQKMYERDARGGTRYTELIRSHFGVISPDARLQRPEFLGGGTSYINVSPIAQTSASADGSTAQGNLSAFGTFSSNKNGFIKSFTEHELVFGFISARADLNYQQGLPRMWSRQTRFDFFWPSLAHLGEQAILNKEIYATGTETDDDVFGYQERYAEYRYKQSTITGLFRSNASQSLDVWHLAQNFSSQPALNESFIVENPPIDRIIAVTDEPQFILDCYFDYKCARPMPTFATPGLIDHF